MEDHSLSTEQVQELLRYPKEHSALTEPLAAFGDRLFTEGLKRSDRLDSKATVALAWMSAIVAFLLGQPAWLKEITVASKVLILISLGASLLSGVGAF